MRVVYYSKVRAGVRSADIERLIAGARRRNRQLDLTGALIEGRQGFMWFHAKAMSSGCRC